MSSSARRKRPPPELQDSPRTERARLVDLLNGEPNLLSDQALAFLKGIQGLKKDLSAEQMNAFDDQLNEFSARPQMSFSRLFGLFYVSSYNVVPNWTNDSSRLMWALIDFHRQGRVDLLASCRLCQKWFFGRARTDRFCSRKCKQKFHRSSPEYRYERKYDARYYRNLEAGNTKLSREQWKRKNMPPFPGGK